MADRQGGRASCFQFITLQYDEVFLLGWVRVNNLEESECCYVQVGRFGSAIFLCFLFILAVLVLEPFG